MPPLLNRVPTGRLICLHALLQHLVDKYGDREFTLRDAQYDPDSNKTIHDSCKLLIEIGALRTKVCPFLQNPLSEAKCYLTQSLVLDTQKQKSIGDAVNGLEALGLIDRINRGFKGNALGLEMATLDYFSKAWLHRMKKCSLSYGLFLGFLFIASSLSSKGVFRRKDIKPRMAFPETGDSRRNLFGDSIKVSTGCTLDTMTRTTSLLIKWALTLGFISKFDGPEPSDMSHVDTLEIVKGKNVGQQFKIHISKQQLQTVTVTRPIHYPFLTPDPSARRDLPSAERRVSIEMSPKVINRRYALIYTLGVAAEKGVSLNFSEFKKELGKHREFVVDSSNLENAMNLELNTAVIAGMPWTIDAKRPFIITPLVKMDLSYLSKGAPPNIVREVQEIAHLDRIFTK